MKITFLVSGSIRSNFSYRALSLAQSLHALGHTVSIIAPQADKYNEFKKEKIESIDGVKIIQPYQFATHRLEINLLPYLFGAVYSLLKERPDVVYIYKPTPISIIGVCMKFFSKAVIVLDFDDLGSEVMRLEGHPVYQRKLVEWSEKLGALLADRIVVASTFLREYYHAQYPKKSLYILPNAAGNDWFTPVDTSSTQKRIVFMGSINRKDILEPFFSILPSLAAKHPDVKVEIIGGGECLEYFQERVASVGLAAMVTFTGWLPIEEAKKHLMFGDIGYNYMPEDKTIRAASNMKVPQYMSRGVVPIVSNVGDLAATVSNGEAGYIVTPNDENELLRAFSEALEDTDRLHKAEKACAIAVEKLSWNVLATSFNEWLYPTHKAEKKKIYFVATTVPADVGGAEIRNFNLLKQLSLRTNAEIDVFCISSKDYKNEAREFTSHIPVRIHMVKDKHRSVLTVARAFFIDRLPPFMTERKLSGLGDMFRMQCEKVLPDIVQIEQLDGYYCILPHIPWLKSKGVKIIFDCHNVEYQAFRDSLSLFSFPKKQVGIFVTRRMKLLEIEAAKSADKVFACSIEDARFFLESNSNVEVVPNGVDTSTFEMVTNRKGKNILFIGGTKYPPNADAIQFYLRDIMPLVQKEIPDTRFTIIGADKEWLDAEGIKDESITPLGFVEDIRKYLNEATIGICPVRYGSGTRIKIMTYMAAGLPVVSTDKGAEGVGYVHGRDILISNTAVEFARDIQKLLNDASLRDDIAQNGHAFILQNYDWNSIGEKFASSYYV